ncbi:MAG: lytic transglycosylase domain-containing protein [Hyphomicrobiales bacterium]|nr:lytic transglycosylase domain-containing protein [Hyphomicrobiales bacterium]
MPRDRLHRAAPGGPALLVLAALAALIAGPAAAISALELEIVSPRSRPAPPDKADAPDGRPEIGVICDLIEQHARHTGMAPAFFARLIWTESRFDHRAISPKGARGIAQFMPQTAADRGLKDPFDIAQAIPHSATYLRDLKAEFGNWGLAAAAYNAGPERVRFWLGGTRALPRETRDYVRSITGRAAEDWSADEAVDPDYSLDENRPFRQACIRLPVTRTRATAMASAPWQPWGVQIAGDFSQSRALSQFRLVQKRFRSVIGGHEPIIVRAKAPSRGRRPIYAIRIGAEDKRAAEKLCARLRGKGGFCIVMKN